MGISRKLVSLVACLAVGTPACAATLGSVQGTVMVNSGSGYQGVYGSTQLKPGDVVVVNPGGSAQISYPDGCSVPVQVGAVVTIGAQSPCAIKANTPQGPGGPGGLGGPGIFILNAGIAAGAVGILLATQKDKAASP